jgi:hypothetical protein
VGGNNKGNNNKASMNGLPAQAVTANHRAKARPSGSKTSVVNAAKVKETLRAGQSMGLRCWAGFGAGVGAGAEVSMESVDENGLASLDYCGKA